jgi:hypothetical protein
LRGPWGTAYATNLLLTVKPLTEDGFVLLMSNLKTPAPMPGIVFVLSTRATCGLSIGTSNR